MQENKFSKGYRIIEAILKLDDNITLNSSFSTSLYAADIDLYQPASKDNIKDLRNLLKNLKPSKIRCQFVESKMIDENDKVIKRKTLKNTKVPDNVVFLKLDFISTFMAFPIEVTIIYDFKPEKLTSIQVVTDELLKDMPKHKNNYYKLLKRAMSIFKIHGINKKNIEKIVNNATLGKIYQIYNQKMVLNDFQSKDKEPFTNTIHEDLRRLNIDPKISSSQLLKKLNKMVKSQF